jgi:hypothetical protein
MTTHVFTPFLNTILTLPPTPSLNAKGGREILVYLLIIPLPFDLREGVGGRVLLLTMRQGGVSLLVLIVRYNLLGRFPFLCS